ncbi:glycosyltransferase family 2 protein [Paenibacillus sp. YYML68]|uniref:glycosyltransferase family 2 protein n=1 Tax=Paenibacillus sp. YYML68 TaxID=2909250 RepID=UPI002492D9A5|nr:glycosyltransferase family 2 protein [Paenibacillus sp. YYML68]
MVKSLVIIPAYNEEKSIASVITGIREQQLDVDILVVNDGSADRTAQLAAQLGVYVISHPSNIGYGSALQTGYKFASLYQYPYIIQFDGDGQHDPSTLRSMIEEMNKGTSDIVIGSRFLNNERIEMHVGPHKRAVAGLFRDIIRVLTGKRITDTTSGLRCIRLPLYREFAIKNRFPMEYPDADFLIRMLYRNLTITEVPVNMRDREHGESQQHGGLKPIIYMCRMMLNILIVFVQYKFRLRVKNNA